ncbi:MAG: CvpA family protein [Acetobacteraceae bacterium]|nr:CvpA family protein [Acetobacteraceae bacterium]
MTWVDGLALLVIVLSAILGFARGFVAETLGLGAWIGAAVAAFLGEPYLRPYAEGLISPPWLLDAVLLGVIFLVVLVVLMLIIGAIASLVRRSPLAGLDRSLGGLFGAARGAAILVLAYVGAGLLVPQSDRWPAAVREAAAIPYVVRGAEAAVALLPPDLRPRLPDPAPGAQAPTGAQR